MESVIHQILRSMSDLARDNKASSLDAPEFLSPLNVSYNKGGEYQKGVCDAIHLIYGVISRSSEGRKAISDLGFEPLYEKANRP